MTSVRKRIRLRALAGNNKADCRHFSGREGWVVVLPANEAGWARGMPPATTRPTAWWAGHHVAIKRRGTRTYIHLVVGEITLDWDTFTYDADPDQQLIVNTAEPGSPSEQALRIPASSATNGHEPARSLTD